jgi:hypothetical protein
VSVTRRALLRRAAGATSLLALPPQSAPALVWHGLRCFSLTIGSLRGTSAPIPAGDRFALVGASWLEPTETHIELRARGFGGAWTRWAYASALGHGGDADLAAEGIYGEPIWTGPAAWVQLRASTMVRGLRLHFIDPGRLPPESPPGAHDAGELPLVRTPFDAGGGQPPIIARRAWDDGRGPRFPPGYGSVLLAFVHHTDTPNGYTANQVPSMLRSIYAFHRYVRGWNDIGYNFLVDSLGRIWEGRAGGVDLPVAGAQAGGYNIESTGIALLGTFNSVTPTLAAQDALTRLLAWKLSLHGTPVVGRVTVEVDPSDAFYTPFSPGEHVMLPRIAGHRDGCTTGCPGNVMYGRLPAIRPAVARLCTNVPSLTIALTGGRLIPASFLTLAGSELNIGAPLTVSGRLESQSGAPIAAAPVILQTISTDASGEASERVLASLITVGDGSWTTAVPTDVNLLLRAAYTGPPAVVSPLAWVAAAPAVTLELVPGSPPTRSGVAMLAGTVTPGMSPVAIFAVPSDQRSTTVSQARMTTAHPQHKHRGTERSRQLQPLRRTVAVVNEGFVCRLRLPPGSWRVWAETLADTRNVAGRSLPLLLRV